MQEPASENIKKEQLMPKQVYLAAIGMFETPTSEYALVGVAINQAFSEYEESARIYIKDGKHHILYYPGKDNDKEATLEQRTTPLKTIITNTKQEIIKNEIINDQEFQQSEKYFILCQTKPYFFVSVNHYVFAHLSGNTLIIKDSIDRNYDTSGILASIKTINSNATARTINTDYQNFMTDTWQCGHFSLMELHGKIIKEILSSTAHEINNDIINLLEGFYVIGSQSFITKQSKNCQNNTPNPKKEIITLDDDDDVWHTSEIDKTAKTETISPKKSFSDFLDDSPILKNALWGMGIVLGITAVVGVVIGIIIGTAGIGAIPFLAGSVAAIGSLSIGSAVGIGFGIATVAAMVGAFFGVIKHSLFDDAVVDKIEIKNIYAKNNVAVNQKLSDNSSKFKQNVIPDALEGQDKKQNTDRKSDESTALITTVPNSNNYSGDETDTLSDDVAKNFNFK